MSVKRIAAIVQFSVLTVFLAIPGVTYALEDIEIVTPERAAELGLIVRAQAAGPDHVSVELEFPTTGELNGFRGVELRIEDSKKLVFSSTLKEDRSEQGHVIVRFYADRARIPQIELKVATRGDALTRVGHVLPLKDFVDVTKLR